MACGCHGAQCCSCLLRRRQFPGDALARRNNGPWVALVLLADCFKLPLLADRVCRNIVAGVVVVGAAVVVGVDKDLAVEVAMERADPEPTEE